MAGGGSPWPLRAEERPERVRAPLEGAAAQQGVSPREPRKMIHHYGSVAQLDSPPQSPDLRVRTARCAIGALLEAGRSSCPEASKPRRRSTAVAKGLPQVSHLPREGPYEHPRSPLRRAPAPGTRQDRIHGGQCPPVEEQLSEVDEGDRG